MERRNFLGRLGVGAAAGLGSFAAVGAQGVPGGKPDLVNRNSFRTADFGAVGDGVADDTVAIQRSIDAAYKLGGGTVYLEGAKGRNFKCGGQLNLDGKRGVRVVGSAGPNVPDTTQPDAQLNYSGTAAPFISLKSTHSVTFEFLKIGYSNPAFRGSLVETGHDARIQADAAYLLFDRCRFTGNGKASKAAHLLSLPRTICSTVRGCEFQGADVGVNGITGAGTYSNVIQVTDCAFRDLNTVAIKNGGESWLISGCAFEPLVSGRGAAYYQGAGTSAWGLTILCCWMGDATAAGGCWIDMTAGPAYGMAIIGNRMAPPGSGPRDTAIKIGRTNQGVTIAGNRIEGAIGIDFTEGHTFGASITGNDLQCFTPIANLSNAMSHFVAGQYQTQSKLSGYSTFEMATFTGEGVRGAINLVPQKYAPTKPQDGDVWIDWTGMCVRINGVTKHVRLE